jgi:hypothetical protein
MDFVLSLLASAAVLAFSATGSDVVSASAAKAPGCPQIVLQRHAVGQTIRLPRSLTACESTSTGSGIAGVATARGRVLWLYYAGGNNRDWLLYTASTARRTPRQIRFVERPVESPAPIVLGRPDEGNLPYAVDNVVFDLRPDGSRRWTWTAPGPVGQLAAGNDRVAVQLRDGRTYVLSRSGVPGAPQQLAPGTIRLAFAGLAHQDGSLVYVGARGYPILADSQLADFIRNAIFYAHGSQVRGIRFSDGKNVLLARGQRASMGRGGLAYVDAGKLQWLPWAVVSRRFGD